MTETFLHVFLGDILLKTDHPYFYHQNVKKKEITDVNNDEFSLV